MATAETESATHSGKLLVRMPRTLHADLAAAADQEGVSLNAFIVGGMQRSLGVVYDEDALLSRLAEIRAEREG